MVRGFWGRFNSRFVLQSLLTFAGMLFTLPPRPPVLFAGCIARSVSWFVYGGGLHGIVMSTTSRN